MTQDAENPAKKCERRKRRLWPRWLKLRVVLALLLLLGYAGWRYGWPARSWETTVYQLEEIDWLEAARLAPQCVAFGAHSGGAARNVLLSEGSLDASGNLVFDLEHASYLDPELVRLHRNVLSELKLPDLSGRWFRAGLFWVDLPAEHESEPVDAMDPALAYSVLLMCDESARLEDAAELIVDLNRNRDLTDDPVMTLSDAWSHEYENPSWDIIWFVRLFDPVELWRRPPGEVEDGALSASVRALPTLAVRYYHDESEPEMLNLSFSPTSYRKGQLTDGGITRDIVISPDRTRFGRFDGPAPGGWSIDGDRIARNPLTRWNYARGAFWGCTLDADGQTLCDGPYAGPTGTLRAETARGESLRIQGFSLWLRGGDSRKITGSGWAPVPRFPRLRVPISKQPLPVGDYGMTSLSLVHGWNRGIVIETRGHQAKSSPQEFSIENGGSTVYRLPKTLQFEAYAVIEYRPRPHHTMWSWSSEADSPDEATGVWKGPQPGSKVKIGVSMSDTATDQTYAIYYGVSPPADSLQLVITDCSGNTVHRDTMEYG